MEASSATNPIASPFQLFHQKLFTAAEMLRCRGKFPPWEVSKGIWPQVGAWVVLVGQNVGWTNGDVRALLRIIWLKLFKQATGMAAPNWVIILLPSPHYLILHKLNLGNLDPPPSPLSPPPKKVLRVRVSWTVRLHHSTRILPLQAERQFVTLFPAVYPHTTPPLYILHLSMSSPLWILCTSMPLLYIQPSSLSPGVYLRGQCLPSEDPLILDMSTG